MAGWFLAKIMQLIPFLYEDALNYPQVLLLKTGDRIKSIDFSNFEQHDTA